MNFVANFNLNKNEIEADFEVNQPAEFDAVLEINPAGANWGSITGNLSDQTDLQNALDLKADKSEVEEDITTLDNKIDNVQSELSGDISALTQTVEDNNTAINNRVDGVVDSFDADIEEINTTIGNYGNIVTYNVSDFATSAQGLLADTALQPNDNISELNNDVGYITSASLPTVNNNTITIQKNGTNVDSFTLNQSTNKSINITVPTNTNELTNGAGYTTNIGTVTSVNDVSPDSEGNVTLSIPAAQVNSDWNASSGVAEILNKPNLATVATTGSYTDLSNKPTINDLTTTAQQNALNSGATSTNIGQITTNENDIADIRDLIPTQATSTNQLADKDFVNSSIATNTANFIGTFNSVAELEAYSGPLTNNDYAFVATTDSAGNTLYDRYKYNANTQQWIFEYELNNSSFTAAQWASINSGITSGDVSLIQSALQPNDNISELVNDAGYITSASLPTVNDGTLTISVNGTVTTFSANQSTNSSATINIPTDTSDLTNGAGYITGITSSDVTTALGYTPYDSSNPSGYTSNVGTVTSVNNTQPVNGNVTISIPDTSTLANKDLSNLSTTGNAKFQTPLVSGTNIKTVNNESILGSGNITIQSSGANTDLSNLTATGEAHFQEPLISGTNIKTINSTSLLGSGNISALENTATATSSITVDGVANTTDGYSINIGKYSEVANSYLGGDVVIGSGNSASLNAAATGGGCTAIGYRAKATGQYSIQLGWGTNSTNKTLAVGFQGTNFELLNGTTGFIPDARINKQTSITSSSTDDQIPSAKCVYDELADVVRQETTDTINLYCWSSSSYDFYTTSETLTVSNIGDFVYNTNYDVIGEITVVSSSTEISVMPYEGLYQSSCIRDTSKDTTFTRSTLTDNNSNALNIVQADGQWVLNYNASISTVTTKSSTTIDISSYLPSDSSTYNYEIMVNLYAEYNSAAGNVAIGTSSNPLSTDCFKAYGRVRDTSRSVALFAILPISNTNRYIYTQRENAVSTCRVDFIGYRRIGTNS